MKRPGLFEGILVAGGLGLLALPASFVGQFLSWPFQFNLMMGVISFFYIVYLLGKSESKTGRAILGSLSLGALSLAFFMGAPNLLFLGLSISLIWVVRSLYAYSSLIMMGLDAGLCGLGAAFAGFTLMTGGGFALAVWSFFLMQSLFVLIPKKQKTGGEGGRSKVMSSGREREFSESHKIAEEAIRQIVRA